MGRQRKRESTEVTNYVKGHQYNYARKLKILGVVFGEQPRFLDHVKVAFPKANVCDSFVVLLTRIAGGLEEEVLRSTHEALAQSLSD